MKENYSLVVVIQILNFSGPLFNWLISRDYNKLLYLNKLLLTISIGILCLGCKKEPSSTRLAQPLRIIAAATYKLPVYDYDHFKALLSVEEEGVVRVVNFWATWCKPCLKELPAFKQVYATYKDQKVEVILVSLDFPDQVETRLIPFIKDKDLKMPVIFLDDPHTNEWIPKVSPEWSGALPATAIITPDSFEFYEQSFDFDSLEAAVLNNK